jgi:hypothetical protein
MRHVRRRVRTCAVYARPTLVGGQEPLSDYGLFDQLPDISVEEVGAFRPHVARVHAARLGAPGKVVKIVIYLVDEHAGH